MAAAPGHPHLVEEVFVMVILPFTLDLVNVSFSNILSVGIFASWRNKYRHASSAEIDLLKTKRNLLYIRNQSVPHCKHFPPRL